MAAITSSKKLRPLLYSCIPSFRSFRREIDPSLTIGFVPTMGALHEGHLSLVKEARSSNDIVVASVFVNPTQFGEGEDLDKYPRQMERDTKLLGEAGVDHIFAPNVDDIYGENYATYIDCKCFDDIAESIARPGHFRGVATIVTKLFNIVQPTSAYFGQKDAGQCVLIRRIVEDLNIDVNVVIGDTIRESDGLAKSSRNAYLSPTERQASTIIYKSLIAAKGLYATNPSVSSSEIIDVTRNVLRSESLVKDIQYISVESMVTMQPVSKPSDSTDGTTVSLACIIGSVRLIDNIVLKE